MSVMWLFTVVVPISLIATFLFVVCVLEMNLHPLKILVY